MKLFTNNQAQVLAVLLSQPGKDFNLSELGEIIGKHPGVFQRGINSMEKDGLIVSKKRGNQRLFRINGNNPFFDEIKSIIEKTIGVEGLLKEMVNNVKGIIIALIYGSYAKGELRSDSDIDVLIIVGKKYNESHLFDIVQDEILDKVTVIEKKIQRDINYKLYLEDEFVLKRKEKNPFLEEVFSEEYIKLKGKV